MRQPDTKLFRVFAEDDCRLILDQLLESKEPQTQRQLSAALKLKSSVMSRRMAEIEDLGLVMRESSHAPYEILLPTMVRQFLDLGAELAGEAIGRQAEEAKTHARNRRLNGMRQGALLDRAKESS